MKRYIRLLVACVMLVCSQALADKIPEQAIPRISESAQVVRSEIKQIIKDLSGINILIVNSARGNHACSVERIISLNKQGLDMARRWQRLISFAEFPLTQSANEEFAAEMHILSFSRAIKGNEELLRSRDNTGCPDRAA